MRTFKLLLAALLVFGLAAPAAHAGAYGNPNAGDFLANLEVGSSKSRDVDLRFQAEDTGVPTALSVMFICPGVPSGYCNGNGGDVQFKLWNDNGGVPGSTLLCTSSTVTDPIGNQEPTVSLSGCPSISAGTVYHIVAVNTDPSPATNWVSIDDMAQDSPPSPAQPLRPNLAVLYRDTTTWNVAPQHSPIFALTYSDGSRHGPGVPYDNARSQSLPKNIGASNKVAMDFTPSSAVTITGANLRVQKNAGATAGVRMFVRLAPNGTVVTSQTTSAIPSSSTPQWVHVTFSSAVTLSAGTAYRFVADSTASASSAYTTWPLTQVSWSSPWKFTQGFARWSSDGGATYGSSANDDWQWYLDCSGTCPLP